MSATASPWETAAKEICASLADGLDVAGTVESADIFSRVGSTCLEVVIDASDSEGADQAEAYRVLCDLLETRLRHGPADEVFGCILFATEPSVDALAVGLAHMIRDDNQFVPVLPLGRDRAHAIAGASAQMADFADDAGALIETVARRLPQTVGGAETLLSQLDELIDRRITDDAN
ncbi:MAG: hypothetical protein ACR2QK_12420 [Acidimicrobiales bacterium]